MTITPISARTAFAANGARALAGEDAPILRASYGGGFKAPSLYQLYTNDILSPLKPETSKAWDVGVEQPLAEGKGRYTLTWFDRKTPATANALREMGFEVVTVPIASDLDAARGQVRQLARLAGNPELGRRLIARIDEVLARAAPPPGGKPMPALVWQSGGLVAGDDTLIADMLRHTGFTGAAGARGLSQADFLPLEQMLADPPRVVFAAGNSPAEEDRMLRHRALASLRGTVRIPLDSSILWCGGPTIPRALDRLAEARRELARNAGNLQQDPRRP